MKTEPGDLKVRELLSLKSQQMLVVNSEYQRGDIWLSLNRCGWAGYTCLACIINSSSRPPVIRKPQSSAGSA